MKASLLLAYADRKVVLVEESSVIGGGVIRCEDIYPAMECATCMVSPMQQEVLRNAGIQVLTLSRVTSIEGSAGSFRVAVSSRASSVDPEACIGCAECWGACPVQVPNRFEENLSKRSAISVPCAGALPNVPWIDRENCLRWTENSDCTICMDSCVFAAIDYDAADTQAVLEVSDIILATGFSPMPPDQGEFEDVITSPAFFTAPEFERHYASNGPTAGELQRKDGRPPVSAAVLVHAGGIGAHSRINTMYCLKFIHYLHEKLPDIRPLVLLDAEYDPDGTTDPHHSGWQTSAAELVRYSGKVSSSGTESGILLTWDDGNGENSREVDLLVVGTPMAPSEGTREMAELTGTGLDERGFALVPEPDVSSVSTSVPGIFLAGCSAGPMDVASSVASAAAAVGRILSRSERSGP
jgi:heterodisulfide reductase subunit A